MIGFADLESRWRSLDPDKSAKCHTELVVRQCQRSAR